MLNRGRESLVAFAEHYDIDILLTLLRSMNNLEPWHSMKDAMPDQVDVAAQTVQETALNIVEDG